MPWLLALLLFAVDAISPRVTFPAPSRDFGWLLDLSNASCDAAPSLTPGFNLTSGSIPDDYLGCPCECDQTCQESSCHVNFSFTFSVPIRRLQFVCSNCWELQISWTNDQVKLVQLDELEYGTVPLVHIRGRDLRHISAAGVDPLEVSALRYDFGYEDCNRTDHSNSIAAEICEDFFQEGKCCSVISDLDHDMQIADLCPVSCGLCPGSENRTWTSTTTSSTQSSSTSNSSTSSTVSSGTTTSSSFSNTTTTLGTSASVTASISTTATSTRSITSVVTTAFVTSFTTSSSTTSSTSSTSTSGTSGTTTSSTITATTVFTTATTKTATTTATRTEMDMTNASMDEVIDDIISEMLTSMDTQVIRESETAMIMAQQLVAPVTALGADDATVYLPVEWQGRSDVSCSIPSSLVDEAGGALTVVVAALKTGSPDAAPEAAPAVSLGDDGGEAATFSPMVRVAVYGSDGAPLVVRNLEDPVLITLKPSAVSGPLETWTCVFWNETEKRWSTEGVVRLEGAELICATTHLTLFSAILRQLRCLNVQVFSSASFQTAGSRPWHVSVAAILFWVLVSGWLLLLSLAWQGSSLASHMAWKDENFVLKVPSTHQPPSCCQYCQGIGQALRDMCCTPLRSVQTWTSSARTTDWEEALALYVGLLGVHCLLAVRSGTSVTMLRRHLINKDGWIHYDMASTSSAEVKALLQKLSAQVPEAFLTFAEMDFWRRCRLFLRALHPYSSSVLLSLEQSPAIRMKLKADVMFGALAVSAFFFALTESGTSFASPEACAQSSISPWRFVLMGFFSASFVSIPVSLMSYFWQRSFVDSASSVNVLQRQLWRWRLQDCFMWMFSFCYTIFCCVYVALFIANLNGKDHWKWILTFLTIILRLSLLQPLFLALLLAGCATLVQRRRPKFFSEGHPGLHFQVQLPVAQDKVKDLASRSISVADLLHFWEKIPEKMPHFDENATTHDVVRQVVIPMSKMEPPEASCAYATMLAGGNYRPPDVMVTHNWGNKFSHLLAAIFSEAMAHRTYETTARRLAQKQTAILQEELRTSLLRRYWICCFCVNQHASICDSGPAQDSMGVPISKCTCGVPKHWSGAQCEMDKFDAMIGYLAAVVPTFCQVVAVDMNFMVFTRVWCIAELVEARHHRLQQFPIVHSESSLQKSMQTVTSLDVRNAEASVPADKDRVLEKIHDFDLFNEDLKDLLLHREVGLLSRLSLELCSEAIGAREALEATTQLAVELLPLPGCAE